MSSEPPTQKLGEEGDACAECGAVLATDQRYCLNCGAARAEPRLSVQEYLRPAGAGPPAVAAAAPGHGAGVAPGPSQQWSMVTAVFAIALLGVMLLLGVLIGKEDDDGTVAAAPTTTTTAVAAPPPTTTAPTEAPADKGAADPSKNAAAAGAPGPVEKGGSGDTEGIAAADTDNSAIENAKSGPDVVATQGEKAPPDPGGQAGAGSDAVCIGC